VQHEKVGMLTMLQIDMFSPKKNRSLRLLLKQPLKVLLQELLLQISHLPCSICQLHKVFGGVLGIYRMFILLPFIGAVFSGEIIDYLSGLNFVLFSFRFLPIGNSPVIKDVINYFDYDQKNENLNTFKLKSSSMLVNHLNLFLIFLIIMLIH
jgi:hypothetical protein